MTATKAPAGYVSGWCGSDGHARCRGGYAGCACSCPCHTEPEPELVAPPARHCPTCACDGHA